MSGNILIKVDGIKKYYNGGEVKALDGVSCTVSKGEVLAIIGRPAVENPLCSDP